MNNNNQMQQYIANRYKQMQQMEEYNRKKKRYGLGDYLTLGNQGREFLGNTGKNLMNSSNQKTSGFGQKLYKYSGQQFVDNFKNNAYDTTKNMFNQVGSKLGFGQGNTAANTASTTGNMANTANTASNAANTAQTASTAANTASTASSAGNAASSATGALSSVGSAASKAAPALGVLSVGSDLANKNYVDAGIDTASTAASFIPVYGWAAAAALQAGKAIKNMVHGAKQEEAQKATEQTINANNSAVEDKKSSAMQNIAQNGQDMLQQQYSPITQGIYDKVYADMTGSPQERSIYEGYINDYVNGKTFDYGSASGSEYDLSLLRDDELDEALKRRRNQ